ncbi:MAG: DUF885 domain-containing protein [Chloroflexi bacterium]|nr:DUF885 domain-containing protein [Chloroflexota bacterium]
MSEIYDIADKYVDRIAELHPIIATYMGVPGHDHRLPDYSPDGAAERMELSRSTLAELQAAPVRGEADRLARDVMVEELETDLQEFERKTHLYSLNVIASPVQGLRQIFDLMPRDTAEEWENIASRMAALPEAFSNYQEALQQGQSQGLTASTRQAREAAKQAESWSGQQAGTPSFFQGLIDAYDGTGIENGALREDLSGAASTADAAYAGMQRFLLDEYLPKAREKDGVGKERYEVAARRFLGMEIDPEETYEWGWEELARIEKEIAKTAQRILPGESLEAVTELMGTDPARAIEGEENFRDWMQDIQEETIADMDGTHFDIAEPVKKIECLIAPPGGQLAMYYTSPSEDFSRPGRVWYPTGGKTRFPLWTEVSIAYHEGVPGHHFQLATVKHLSDRLSRFQRNIAGTSGHAEGWALYAERLMAELGYLENPDYYLGMQVSQAFRAARVIIDIGMHLDLEIPSGQPFHPGETWTPELGLEFLIPRCPFEEAFARSEINRYLGWPGQAISYKVGERVFLERVPRRKRSRAVPST